MPISLRHINGPYYQWKHIFLDTSCVKKIMYYFEFTASVKKTMDHSYKFHLVFKEGSS